MYVPASAEEVEAIFAKRLAGEELDPVEKKKFETAFMIEMGREYHKKNWVMQLHFAVKRDNNQSIFHKIGADAGIDCISNFTPADQMADFLNALAETEQLPKTILYSLNPIDNAAIGTILGCFQDASCVGKIQQGSAWWFNDNKQGMIDQMVSLANLGLLGNFIGMLTDSRSFLSYTRHEYFRRIACELIGGWVENGEYPADEKVLAKMIKGISYNNAVRYFGFDLETK
jgi:glucuronate isomerase